MPTVWHGPLSHGTICFGLMVKFVWGADPMKSWTPAVNQALCRLVVVPYRCGVFAWVGSSDGIFQHMNLTDMSINRVF